MNNQNDHYIHRTYWNVDIVLLRPIIQWSEKATEECRLEHDIGL